MSAVIKHSGHDAMNQHGLSGVDVIFHQGSTPIGSSRRLICGTARFLARLCLLSSDVSLAL
eukprot:6334985-Heterocapsa_arctica.AAC.1